MKTITRIIIKPITDTLARGKSVLLLGPRQTGKTTLVKQLPHDRYITFINPQIRIRYEQSPSILIAEVQQLQRELRKQPIVILDEIQKVPDIMDAVQYLIDEKIALFVITGSSARRIRNLLPGRVIQYHLDPLCIEEYAKYNDYFPRVLVNGSLPGIFTQIEQHDIDAELATYVNVYLEEEIRKEALVRNLAAFSQCLRLASIESGNLLSFRKIAAEIGVAHTTIQEYFRIFEDCMVIERFDPITTSNTRKRLTKSTKYILFDLGLRRLAADEGYQINQKQSGYLFEQWIGLELKRLLRRYLPRAVVKFWRDHSGPEVDFVIEHEQKFIPIEVKWTDKPKIQDARHLDTFINEYSEQTKNGYIICQTPYPMQMSETITAISFQDISEMIRKLIKN